MPSFLPEPYTIAHIARAIDTSEINPDTGDPRQVSPAAVLRRVRAIAQEGHRGSSHQIFTAESVKKIETTLTLAVARPEVYAPMDQVRLFPELDENADYISGSGISFWVDGLVRDDRLSPWPSFTRWTGGSIRIKRVT